MEAPRRNACLSGSRFPYGNRDPLPLGSDPTRSWECNEKRVAEEYATTSMSIVMPTMAQSMTQFGLLMILVVIPMQMLCGGVTLGRACPQIEFIDPLSVETARLLGRSLPFGADFTAPTAFSLARRI
jgi:hypothetical protein